MKPNYINKIAKLSSGNAVGMLITLSVYTVLTRIYTDKDFGILGLASSYYSVVAVAGTLCYEFSLVSAKNDEHAYQICKFSLISSLVVAVCGSVFLLGLIKFEYLGFGNLGLAFVIPITLTVLAQSISSIFRYLQLRFNDIEGLSKLPIYQNATRITTQLSLGYFGINGLGLLLGELLSRGYMAFYSIKRVILLKSITKRIIEKPISLTIVKEYNRFPFIILPSNLINTAVLAIQIPTITTCFGLGFAGAFNIARAAFALPLKVLGSSIADIFHQDISTGGSPDYLHIKQTFIKTSGILLLIGFPLSIISINYAEGIFAFVFGDSWRTAGDLASIITPWALGQFVVGSISRTVFVLDMKGLKLIYDISSFLLILMIPFLKNNTDLTPREITGVYASLSALAYILYYCVMLTIVHVYNKKYTRLTLHKKSCNWS
ncbi:oligosaccharide flippase family protein [Verrucomicrobia bacterium]|nr:oligosaccharide flippase family protein [Verrucomicrobiota bacterium]